MPVDVAVHAQAQGNFVYDKIQRAKSSGEKFEALSVLTPASRNAKLNQRIQDSDIDKEQIDYFKDFKVLGNENLIILKKDKQ